MLIPYYRIQDFFDNKKILSVHFDIENGDVLSKFLMVDVVVAKNRILDVFDRVLLGDCTSEEFSGNASYVSIDGENTVIFDKIDDELYCSLNTKDLYLVMLQWCDKHDEFYGNSK